MKKYFLDTTILAEALLKGTPRAKAIRAQLKNINSELPVFAIREFKKGPLGNWVWFHNKLALTKSVAASFNAIQSITGYRAYRAATALEALSESWKRSIANRTLEDVREQREAVKLDELLADQLRLEFESKILRSWKRRRQVSTQVSVPLSCYIEVAPTLKNGLLDIRPDRCFATGGCCLAGALKEGKAALKKLFDANATMPRTRESNRRGKALRQLIRKPGEELTEEQCRNLGDALFAFFAPTGSIILTTNLKDHSVLAEAIGKKAEAPNAP